MISGTYYVTVPEGAGPIVYEDPRLAMLMAAPPRKATAPRELQSHVSETPKPGTLLLWESWLATRCRSTAPRAIASASASIIAWAKPRY